MTKIDQLCVITDEIGQDFEHALDVVAEYGVKNIDLRKIWSKNIADFTDDELNQLKEALAKNNVIIGSKKVIKGLKAKDLEMVFIAKNCPQSIKKDLNHYASLSNVKIEEFDGTGKQLGTFCGKPFSIATIGIVK